MREQRKLGQLQKKPQKQKQIKVEQWAIPCNNLILLQMFPPWCNFSPKSSNKSKAHGFICRCLLVVPSAPSADEHRHCSSWGENLQCAGRQELLCACSPSHQVTAGSSSSRRQHQQKENLYFSFWRLNDSYLIFFLVSFILQPSTK